MNRAQVLSINCQEVLNEGTVVIAGIWTHALYASVD